ncbi:MAG: DUF5681 domain-containing protein [Alphaproteobacteria bacterium]
MAENSPGKVRGRPFQKGKSGNPAGKPKGARHRATLLAEKLMADDAEEVVCAVVAAAKAGDMTAAKLVLDRIAPPRKGRAVEFELPPVRTAADVCDAQAALVGAVAAGHLSPEEAASIATLLDASRKAIELSDLEQRLALLEQRMRLQ